MKKQKIFLLFVFLLMAILLIMPSKTQAASDIIVMLDPGHGGSDPGAIGGEILEKNVNWKIATKVKEKLDANKNSGVKGILTRSENECLEIYQIGDKARDNGADFLVSFHINSAGESARGSQVYITQNTRVDRFNKNSSIFATDVLNNLRSIAGIPPYLNSVRPMIRPSSEHRYTDGSVADYYGVIRYSMNYGIPGILIEHCFISNAQDRGFINNDASIERIAEADAQAIMKNAKLFKIDRSKNGINSTIESLSVNSGKTHLVGKAVIVDWINDVQTEPKPTPKIKLVSTDGKDIRDCFVNYEGKNIYYFDIKLDNINPSKQYKIEVSSVDTANIPTVANRSLNPNLGSNRSLGSNNTYEYTITSNTIKMQNAKYTGNLASQLNSLKLLKSGNNTFITGEIIAVEWINNLSNVPRTMPEIKLKSTDGKVSPCFVKQVSGNTYYFDINISTIDTTKQYYLEISIENNTRNNSTNKSHTVNLNKISTTIGNCLNNKILKRNGNNLLFAEDTYVGDINSALQKISLGKSNNASYISGEIVIVEWINKLSTVPSKKPVIKLKSTDGKDTLDAFVTATGTNTYYFDRFIEGIDTSKKYYFEVSLGADSRNVSKSKSMKMSFGKYNNKTLGKYSNKNIKLSGQELTFENDTYIGNINSALQKISLGKAKNASYISGEIVIVEWINNLSTVPSKKPVIKLKSTDGKETLDAFVTATGTNTYYFDRFIEGINTDKEYYFEVSLGADSRNVSKSKSMKMDFAKYNNISLGKYDNKNIKLSGQKLLFESVAKTTKVNTEKKIIEKPIEKTEVVQNEDDKEKIEEIENDNKKEELDK